VVQSLDATERLDRREKVIVMVMIALALAAAVVSMLEGRVRETVFFLGGGVFLTGILRNRWLGRTSWQDPAFRLSRIRSPQYFVLGGCTMVFALAMP